ncbi:MAG: dephospho-CoA kinase [Gammaproteobacteria bacterium]|nr:dephospho-CoA kinase [Gammaproteobacteria bacterium]
MSKGRPLRIGLTGGYACGKSSATAIFIQLGVPCIDADQVAREIVAPHTPALTALIKLFGTTIITSDGELQREKLRQIVFNNPLQRQQLEAVTHPYIRQAIQHWVKQQQGPYLIIAAPLLLEAGWQNEVDHILLIDLPEAEQLTRAMVREQRTAEEIQQVINSQFPRWQRCAAANTIIDNSGDLATLEKSINAFHQHLQQSLYPNYLEMQVGGKVANPHGQSYSK